MRIANQAELKTALTSTYVCHNQADVAISKWIAESASKWLIKNSPEFKKKFLAPIKAESSSLFIMAGGDAAKTYHYINAFGKKERLALEGYDAKDAEAGTLWAFVPRISISHWLTREFTIFNEAREFFQYVLEEKPDEDLRKYTLATLPQQLQTWHNQREERERRRAQALIEAAERQARALDEETRNELELARIALMEDRAGQLIELEAAWSRLQPEVDYRIHGDTEHHTLYQLLTPAALTWEAMFKGSCIVGYRSYLSRQAYALLSARAKGSPVGEGFTVEANKTPLGWELSQFEQWGYKISKYMPHADDDFRDKSADQVRRLLNSLDQTRLAPLTNQSVTFTVNR